MDAVQARLLAGVLGPLADPTRLRLTSLIPGADEACVCELTAPLTVSHHLRVLAGLVTAQRRGTWVYSRARRETLEALGSLFSGALWSRSARHWPDVCWRS